VNLTGSPPPVGQSLEKPRAPAKKETDIPLVAISCLATQKAKKLAGRQQILPIAM